MADLLHLEGVVTKDIRHENGFVMVTAEPRGEPLTNCPECGGRLYKHDKRKNIFADTPIYMKPVKIEVERQRYRCSNCKLMVIPELIFLDEKRRATTRLVEKIRIQCLDQTFTQLSEDVGVSVNTVKNITLDFIQELQQTIQFETPTIMGIDELELLGDYRCVITNLSMNSLYDVLPGRTQATLMTYFSQLPNPEKVEWICTDMCPSLKKLISMYLPNATVIIDKFHVVRMVGTALEEERNKFQGTQSTHFRVNMKKNLQWILLKRPEVLGEEELKILANIKLHFPMLGRAYDLKEQFYEIYDSWSKEEAICKFRQWERNIPEELGSFQKVAKTVNNYFEDIFAYWDAPLKNSNAYVEGHNGLLRVTNRMGRGYSFDMIRAKMLYNKIARKVGSVTLVGSKYDPVTSRFVDAGKIEYGAHIPSLDEMNNGSDRKEDLSKLDDLDVYFDQSNE